METMRDLYKRLFDPVWKSEQIRFLFESLFLQLDPLPEMPTAMTVRRSSPGRAAQVITSLEYANQNPALDAANKCLRDAGDGRGLEKFSHWGILDALYIS